ncbi:NYN domain-containing protein [Bombilactobacillus bombi]|uniref:NYN domain-containing protein n=1 Tax=Bombilactobacillus bombi TaxID=1303590 RepID=A0A3R6UZR8_9LACO|nr:NYN domain-containing protein [Bombilactobacillus bombi]RHW51857.1 NYN domain-containing protein [Bombilactobacillus bombi]
MKNQILIVDGYNVIGTWPQLAKLKKQDHLEEARDQLLDTLANYRKFFEGQIIVVFDAMYVPGIKEQFTKWDLDVIFTPEDVTADTYIQNLSEKLNIISNQVTVVTSDQAVQWTIFSRGAIRLPSYELYKRIQDMHRQLTQESRQHHDRSVQRNNPWREDQLERLANLRDQLSSES